MTESGTGPEAVCRQAAGSRRSRGALQQQLDRRVPQRLALEPDEVRQHLREVLIVQRPDAELGLDQQPTAVVDPRLPELPDVLAGVGEEGEPGTFPGAVHQRRVGELHEDALRPVLEEPSAAVVVSVVAGDELGDRRVADALALDRPAAATVQRKPAVDCRYVGPLGNCAKDDLIHVSSSKCSSRAMAPAADRRHRAVLVGRRSGTIGTMRAGSLVATPRRTRRRFP